MKQKSNLFILILFFFHGFAFGQPIIKQEKLYSIDALKSDLSFYKSKLEQYHPNLFLYSSKSELDHLFDSLDLLITKPLTELGFYKVITLTSSAIKDGHTLILPSTENTEFHNANSGFLPYQISLIGDELYVYRLCTGNKLIAEGTKIVKINGVLSSEIVHQLILRQVRDGHNLSYAYWILDNYFREYYSYVFGHPQTFEIAFAKNGILYNAAVPALSKDSISYYKTRNYPNIPLEMKLNSGITLDLNKLKNTAVLTIKDFHNDVLKSEYHQNFKKSISSYFNIIFVENPNNLILDLRNNQGGDTENGVFLLAYLLKEPFKIVNEYNCLKNGTLIKCSGPSSGWHKPHKQTYNGNIFVLINGGTFSNSAIVSSCLATNNRATFVGSTSGGNPNMLAGYPKELELPNTKIRVEIPTKQFIMTSSAQNDGFGIKPQFTIEPTIIDRRLNIDTELNFVLRLLDESNPVDK